MTRDIYVAILGQQDHDLFGRISRNISLQNLTLPRAQVQYTGIKLSLSRYTPPPSSPSLLVIVHEINLFAPDQLLIEENEEMVTAALAAMRKELTENPAWSGAPTPTDEFLLMFLRSEMFSPEKAAARYRRFWEVLYITFVMFSLVFLVVSTCSWSYCQFSHVPYTALFATKGTTL